ncbi:hypothetical protein [Bacillus xiapuensis]|uniref:hypothetical protein n=1 Tax=Bacillus xiapuensis TaxID=2014075 RepID=UPI0018E26320|nr:hypothetical protein [Bacillus xiapuensis]
MKKIHTNNPTMNIHSDVKKSHGDSIDQYENLKDANELLASKEIGQQNENL